MTATEGPARSGDSSSHGIVSQSSRINLFGDVLRQVVPRDSAAARAGRPSPLASVC
jgi:hypothetical protein